MLHYNSLNKTYLKGRPSPFVVKHQELLWSLFDPRHRGGRPRMWRLDAYTFSDLRSSSCDRPSTWLVTCPDWWQTCSLSLAANIWESKEPDGSSIRGRMKVVKEAEGERRTWRRQTSCCLLPFLSHCFWLAIYLPLLYIIFPALTEMAYWQMQPNNSFWNIHFHLAKKENYVVNSLRRMNIIILLTYQQKPFRPIPMFLLKP